jgi:hypothetical protein
MIVKVGTMIVTAGAGLIGDQENTVIDYRGMCSIPDLSSLSTRVNNYDERKFMGMQEQSY